MYTHYRGTSFQFIGQLQDDGVVQDLTSCTLNVSVYDPSGVTLYGNLAVAYVDRPNGIVDISYPDTSAWPVGKARVNCLLQFANGEQVASPPDYFRIQQTPQIG